MGLVGVGRLCSSPAPKLSWLLLALEDAQRPGHSGQLLGRTGQGHCWGLQPAWEGGYHGACGAAETVKGWIHSRVRLGPMARSFLDARPVARVRVQTGSTGECETDLGPKLVLILSPD